MSGEGFLPPRSLFERMADAQRLDAADEVFALQTGDPRFNPNAPITVNGFRFEPATREESNDG